MKICIYKSWLHNGEQKKQVIHRASSPERAIAYMDDMKKRADARKSVTVFQYLRHRNGCNLSVRLSSGIDVQYFFLTSETGLTPWGMEMLLRRTKNS